MSLEQKQGILMVIAPDQFRDEELNVPRSLFQKEGFQVDVISTRTGIAKGMLGAEENVSQSLEKFGIEATGRYQAIVVVGGMGAIEHLWHQQKLHHLLNVFEESGKVVAGICLSGAVLANAGVLKGKKATVWETPESRKALLDGEAEFTGSPCTIDGKLITANGPEAAQEFATAILNKIRALQPVAS